MQSSSSNSGSTLLRNLVSPRSLKYWQLLFDLEQWPLSIYRRIWTLLSSLRVFGWEMIYMRLMLDIGKFWNSIAFVLIVNWWPNPIYMIVTVDVIIVGCVAGDSAALEWPAVHLTDIIDAIIDPRWYCFNVYICMLYFVPSTMAPVCWAITTKT